MTNYKEILRLHNLGINNSQIAAALGCSRTTVITVQQRACEAGLTHPKASMMSNKEVSRALFPNESSKPAYQMPDYDYIHREMAKSGITLQLLWFEYCDACTDGGKIPYQQRLCQLFHWPDVVRICPRTRI